MNLIQQIALGLANELKQRYPLDEIQAAPSFNYDLMRGGTPPEPPVPTHYSLSAIRDSKCLYSISISGDEITITIHKDVPHMRQFENIEGLPEVCLGIMLSKESDVKRFILADPQSIHNVLAEIQQAYPVS